MTMTSAVRRHFRVRRHDDGHHARIVDEPTFEAAAIAYVEHLHPQADQPSAIRVLVHEIATGHERSFLLPVDAPDTTPAVP